MKGGHHCTEEDHGGLPTLAQGLAHAQATLVASGCLELEAAFWAVRHFHRYSDSIGHGTCGI